MTKSELKRKEQLALFQLPQSIRDRIAHVDFTLLFKGEAVRADLVERFHIAPAQATKDFTLYRELAPNNIQYDPKLKVHKRGKQFTPLFDYDVVRTLATLSQGYGDGFTGKITPSLACEAPYHLNKPDLQIVAKISEAIHQGNAIEIHYLSLSQGKIRCEIVPHTLVDNGFQWYVRAFDRQKNRFNDFILTRIKSAQIIKSVLSGDSETIKSDDDWNRMIQLELVPHPHLLHSAAIELDYGMTNGVVRVEIRAATASYLLKQWHVDCSLSPDLSEQYYPLWLRNGHELHDAIGSKFVSASCDAPQRQGK